MKKNLIVSAIALSVVGLIIFRLATNKHTINERNQPAKVENILIPVSVAPVIEESKQIGMIKTGMLTPFKEAKLLSASSGTVKRVLFKLGDNVQQGQVLAVVDTRLLELDIQKSESNISKLKHDLQTYTELLEGNAATQEKVNDIRQQYTDAVNQAQQLKKQIADANIKAPIGGVIGLKTVEEGMYVAANTELATIVNLSQLKVQVNVTESEVYQMAMGQHIKLSTDVYPGRSFQGSINYISPRANEAYNYQVEITARNEKDAPLRSGTFVYADFSKTTSQKILLIPREALNESIQNASVYVVSNGKAILRNIKVGTEYDRMIEVINGLQKGEQIVTSGQINLHEGSLVNISK
jgi:RND family efflux transporter MFP subunit